ncbi:MAG: hypothetical protein MJZ14_03100 [Paludibacteraceae bacterium]|nr:hypothetical protein [Paludibacteraceae bacterium]
MKHFFTSVLMMLSTLTAVAQYQFTNNSFEQWDSNKEPSGWNSYPTAGGDFSGQVRSDKQIESSTDAHSGTYATKLMARSVLGIAIANGMLTTGQISGNSMKPSDPTNNNLSDIKNGYCMKFTGKPDSLALWVKMNYATTSQKSRLHVLLHDAVNVTDPNTEWKNVVAVAGMNMDYSTTWKRYSVPFYYKGETLTIDCDNSGKSTPNDHTPASSSARPSYVLATIATNYMAGKGNKSDVLLVDDVLMIYNSSLKSLKVNGAAVSGFSKTKYAYTVNSTYSDGCVEALSDGRGATVTVKYDESTYICTITVKGDDYSSNSSNIHTYTIQFNKPVVYNSLLTSLSVNGTSVANFSSATTSYNVSPISYEDAKVAYTASDKATVTESFDATTNVLTLTVKGADYASNSANVHVYKVTFHAPYASLLTSLKVNGKLLSPVAGSTSDYVVSDAAYATSTVDYTVSADATVDKSFDATTNVMTLTVKGGDYALNNKNVHTYKITFHAPFGSSLTALKVNGASVANFASTTYAYTISNAAYATSTVEYTASADATVDKSFDSATNVLTLTVKGGDYAINSKNVQTYKITFHAPFASELTSLKVNGTSVPKFSGSTYNYMVSNAAYATSTVDYTASEGATVEKKYDAATDVLTITVKGGDFATNSKNIHTYTIAFHASFESLLTSLKVNGTALAGFSSATSAYKVTDAAYATSTVEYTASAEATVDKSFDATTNVLTLTVKGGDYATNSKNVHTYTVTFHAPFEAVLTSLKVNGTSVAKFSSSTLSYAVDDAAYATSTVEYTASAEATVEKSFDSATNILTLTVKGGDFATNSKNVTVYKVAFHADFGAYLVSLSVNGASVSAFAPSVYEYSVKDAAYTTSVVEYEASAGAIAEKNFDATTNVLTITVKGADFATNPKNTNTYKVTFHAPFEAVLTSLSVNGAALSGSLTYKLDDAAYATSKVVYTASAEAKVEESYDASTNILTLTVKGGDFATNSKNVTVYTIQFHASFESFLTTLKVNGVAVDKFASATYAYLCPVDYATSKVEYTASTEAVVTPSFDASKNLLTLTVKGGDYATNADNIHTYTVQFYASSFLADLKVDGATVAGFDRTKMEYSVDVTYQFSKIEYTAEDKGAVITESYDDPSATLTITVTGSDAKNYPDNVHVYKVHYHMPYTSYLSALSNNGKALDGFAATQYEYVVDEVYARSEIKYVADEFTTVEKSFDETTNVLTIVVKGGDVEINPTNLHTYKIKFHAPYTSFLANLTVNDVTVEGFAPDQFDYVVDDVFFKIKLDVVTDTLASYSIKYDEKSYVLTIRVESGDIAIDSKNYHVYKIQFNDHNVYNSQLLTLALNAVNYESFDKDVYAYEIEGSYSNITFTYTADSLTNVTEDFDPMENVLRVTVDGGNIDREPTNTHTYEFSFTEQFSFGAQITAIIYDGEPVEWFDKDTYEYTVDLDFNRAHFSYTTNSLAEVYEFFDSESLTLSVVVIGGDLDYSNMNEYTIHFASTSALAEVENDQLSVTYAEGTIWFSEAVEGDYAVYALNGTLLRSGSVNGTSVEVGELPHGIYLVRVNGKTIKVRVGK